MICNEDRVARLSSADFKRYEALTNEFDLRWEETPGNPPSLSDFLPQEEPLRRAVLIDLIQSDLQMRLDSREPKRMRDYLAEFPELNEDAAVLHELTKLQAALVPTVPGFEVLAKIAEGGMGEVWRVRDPQFERLLAVKLMKQAYCDDAEAVGRFMAEARITSQLTHPAIVPVHSLGRLPGGRPYYTMKLVEGRTLTALLRNRSDASERRMEFVQMFLQICQALAFAHSKNHLHRDLKPDNVMVGAHGEFQVMDWGLAKAQASGDSIKAKVASAPQSPEGNATPYVLAPTQPGMKMGTWPYMPPEQARGETRQIDQRSDVFGLGAILCQILTGKPPYVGMKDASEARLDGARVRLRGSGADPELIALAEQCLALNPADRPADGSAVSAAVATYISGVQERLQQERLERERQQVRAKEERRRRKLWLGLAAAVIVAVAVAAAGGLYWQGKEAERRQVWALAGHDLELAEELIDKQQFVDAHGPLGRAEGRLEPECPENLRAQFERLNESWKLATELERIQAGKTTGMAVGAYEVPVSGARLYEKLAYEDGKALEEYEKSFNDAHLNLLEGDVQGLAATISTSPVKQSILSAIDDWVLIFAYRMRSDWKRNDEYRTKRDRLLELARAVDPHPELRDKIRNPANWSNGEELALLAGQAANADLSANLLALLAEVLESVKVDAEPLLRAAQEQSPGDFWLNYQLGRQLGMKVQRGEKTEGESQRFLQAALALRPGSSLILTAVATVLSENETKRTEAITLFQKAIQANPRNATAHNNLGTVHRDQGNHDEAVRCFRNALSIDSNYPLAHANLATELSRQGQLDEALDHLHIAIGLAPDSAMYFRLGNILQDHGRLDGAKKNYIKAIEVTSDSWPPTSWIHNNLGNTLAKQGEFREAEGHFREAIKADPKHALAHTNLANVLEELGYVESAIDLHLRAIEIDPKLAIARINGGNTLYRYGYGDDAVEHLREAVILDPNSPQAYLLLGRALSMEGQFGESLKCLRLGKEIVDRQGNGNSPVENLISGVESLVQQEEKLKKISGGDRNPSEAKELFELADVCRYKQRFLQSAVYFAKALEKEPSPADEPHSGNRSGCARAAVMAAAGQGEDADRLDALERSEWRMRALGWLQTDLNQWRSLALNDPTVRSTLVRTLTKWQHHKHLKSVHDSDAIAKLVPDEQKAWREFWEEVEKLVNADPKGNGP